MLDNWLTPENGWVAQRYLELLAAAKYCLGDVYRSILSSVVYLISSSERTPLPSRTPLYVGVTTQKRGRFNAHIRDARDPMRQRLKLRLEQHVGRRVQEPELERVIRGLEIQWIEEPDRARQERIEHLACALAPPLLNGIGRAQWGTRARSIASAPDRSHRS